jgi:hypothetical protein
MYCVFTPTKGCKEGFGFFSTNQTYLQNFKCYKLVGFLHLLVVFFLEKCPFTLLFKGGWLEEILLVTNFCEIFMFAHSKV